MRYVLVCSTSMCESAEPCKHRTVVQYKTNKQTKQKQHTTNIFTNDIDFMVSTDHKLSVLIGVFFTVRRG